MLQIFIAGMYISWMCWVWGYSLIRLFIATSNEKETPFPFFSIVCFAGLSVIAILSALLSLFIPLGGITAQLFILLPALFLYAASTSLRQALFAAIKEIIAGYRTVTTLLIISLMTMLLILGASEINHPDSLGYHIQTIKWITTYKAVPGLVHLATTLGYQGLWYCLCAFFGFNFTHTSAITFINSTVLAWYLFFLVHKINDYLQETETGTSEKKRAAILYSLLLIFSCWAYGQVRLTATSVSPDFIASLYVWTIFYLLFAAGNAKKPPAYLMLIFFLSCVAVTIKLSVIPIFMLLFYALSHLFKLKKIKSIFLLFAISIITMTPFIARNIITSGYIVFPSAFPDIITADWKISKAATIKEKEYITSFAKQEHQIVKPMPGFFPSWLPVWWKLRSLPDKTILITLLLLLLSAIAVGRKIWAEANQTVVFSIFASIIALIFWFWQAPDPRFGFGFIIPVQGILIYFLCTRFLPNLKIGSTFYLGCLYVISFVITGYSVYRCTHFFTIENVFRPAGAASITYRTISCGSININIPLNSGCSNTQLPCTYYNDCSHFSARGNSITDGFRGK